MHLYLESARRHFPGVPILVVDDCSPDFLHLATVARQYEVTLASSAHRLGHYRGDVASVLTGLFWAQSHGYDFLLKMSRRFIPLYDWTTDLTTSVMTTQYATYCNQCTDTHIGFRTECIALHVGSWFVDPVISRLRHAIVNDCGLIEAYVHNIARFIHSNNCEINKQFEIVHPKPEPIEAYGDWRLPGTSRVRKTTEVLWHHHSPPADYVRQAELFGLRYTLGDFGNVVSD